MEIKKEKTEGKNGFIHADYTYAVIGASNNKGKYGHKVLMDLHEAGYEAIPINPNEKEIDGMKTYPTLSDYYKENSENKIEVVIFVVPAVVTEQVLHEVKELGIQKVWMQPGSESPKAVKFCQDNNISCVSNMCIMVIR